MKQKKDVSVHVHQREKIKHELQIKSNFELNDKQKNILTTCTDKNTKCVFIDGVWGTGKTYILCLAALKLLNEKRISDIYYIRNPVTASRNSQIGFLSGSIAEKMSPYSIVLQDKFAELLPKSQIKALIEEGRIECIPTGFLQGRSFNCSVIIVDEAASMSWEDLMLIISRCGHFTKIFFAGDTQNQVYLSNQSGYKKFFDFFSDEDSKKNGVFTFELKDTLDIVRSDFLQFVMRKMGITNGNY